MRIRHRQLTVLYWVLALAVGIGFLRSRPRQARTMEHDALPFASALTASTQPVDFSHDIAPIIFRNCSVCHHPGASAPFNLLTSVDVRKHARQIASVVEARLMPPWQPDGPFGQFKGDRRLTAVEIDLIRRWSGAGAPEGNPADLPAAPVFAGGWQLGPPDLVCELPAAFQLAAEGRDVYRNLIFPTGMAGSRYVRAVELDPGNAGVMHHSFLLLNTTGSARRRDGRDGAPGFGGMDGGSDTSSPMGWNLSWQPGKRRCLQTDQFPWLLEAGTDLVLQMHLRTSGKIEAVKPRVGVYFTDKPGTQRPYLLLLRRMSLDIPAGASDYQFENTYTLPVEVEALSVLVHAHYLGHRAEAWAVLPDGHRTPLIRMEHWDFNWQSDYEFAQPVLLPRGSVIHFTFSYDNSSANPRNPHVPPRRTTYGLNSDDEMGELALQVLPRTAKDFATLNLDYQARVVIPQEMERSRFIAALRPEDATAQAQFAVALFEAGRLPEAIQTLAASLRLDAHQALAHRCLGTIASGQGNYREAEARFRLAMKNDPDDYRSLCDLGLMVGIRGDLAQGVDWMHASLKINPRAPLTHANLARILSLQGNHAEACREADLALSLDPENAFIRQTAVEVQTHAAGKG